MAFRATVKRNSVHCAEDTSRMRRVDVAFRLAGGTRVLQAFKGPKPFAILRLPWRSKKGCGRGDRISPSLFSTVLGPEAVPGVRPECLQSREGVLFPTR